MRRAIPLPTKAPSISSIAPWAFSVLLFVLYEIVQPSVLNLTAIGSIAVTVLILAVVATGQTIVVLTGGIDLSVGGVISLGTSILATQMHSSSMAFWLIAVLVIGAALGAANGLLITGLKIQPFIVTLATWSIISGIALMVLPAAGGQVPLAFTNFIYSSFQGIPVSLILLAALLVLWIWLKRTRVLRRVYAIGSDEEAAFLSGVPIKATKIAAYSLSGLFAMTAAVLCTRWRRAPEIRPPETLSSSPPSRPS